MFFVLGGFFSLACTESLWLLACSQAAPFSVLFPLPTRFKQRHSDRHNADEGGRKEKAKDERKEEEHNEQESLQTFFFCVVHFSSFHVPLASNEPNSHHAPVSTCLWPQACFHEHHHPRLLQGLLPLLPLCHLPLETKERTEKLKKTNQQRSTPCPTCPTITRPWSPS